MSVLSAARTLGVVSGWTLSNLTMQKTLYIAQMIHLGRVGRPIFAEPFEAWDYGPVVPAFYHEAKRFGAGKVEDIFHCVMLLETNSTEMSAVRDAFATTSHMSAARLVNYTHREGGAWEQYYREGTRGNVIPTEAIAHDWKVATRPSRAALAWAEQMADEVEESPGEYLDASHERAFRARVLRKDLQ